VSAGQDRPARERAALHRAARRPHRQRARLREAAPNPAPPRGLTPESAQLEALDPPARAAILGGNARRVYSLEARD
jgi:hypothetical protein